MLVVALSMAAAIAGGYYQQVSKNSSVLQLLQSAKAADTFCYYLVLLALLMASAFCLAVPIHLGLLTAGAGLCHRCRSWATTEQQPIPEQKLEAFCKDQLK
jgi:hypothetical protein